MSSSDNDIRATEHAVPITPAAALDSLFQPFNKGDAPGLVVGVARHGKTIYRRGFGLASVELGVANTPWTRMRIGSTSKHFTCLAALLLAEEGKLDLDAGVRRYLPELPALKAEATVRQLMNHTNGYHDYLDLGYLADGIAIKPAGVPFATQVRQSVANFAPGEKMMYSNSGYHLLSMVIDRTAGLPFEQFLQERILGPLGMANTVAAPSDFEIHHGMATLHVPLPEGGYRRGILVSEEVRGEGSMISCVDDMLLWLAHLRGKKRVGSDRSWEQMVTPTRLNNGLVIPYGLGLMCDAYRGVDVVQHTGSVVGGSCQMLTVPSLALDIIIMTNATPSATTADPEELALKIIDALLDDALPSPMETKVSADRFRNLLGQRYHAADSGLTIAFSEVQGKQGMAILNTPPVPLRDEGVTLRLGFEDLAAGPFLLHTEELVSGSDSAPDLLHISEGGTAESFALLPSKPPATAESGQPLLGHYRCNDLNADAHVELTGNTLTLRVVGAYGTNEMLLESFAEDLFGWHIGAAQLRLRGVLNVERSQGRVRGFRIDTLRTRQLRFDRVDD